MAFPGRRSRIIATVLVVWFSTVSLAVAGRLHRHRHWSRRPAANRFVRTTRTTEYNRTKRFPDDDWLYPRYTGAFHARYFNEMRYPTGDRGLRGTAW